MGNLKAVLVANCDGEVLGKSVGFLVEWLSKGCRSVHQTGPGWGNVQAGCFGGLGERQGAQRCQNQGCWLMCTKTPAPKDDICC